MKFDLLVKKTVFWRFIVGRSTIFFHFTMLDARTPKIFFLAS